MFSTDIDDHEIDLTDPDEVRLWMDSLGISEDELRAAVEMISGRGRSAQHVSGM